MRTPTAPEVLAAYEQVQQGPLHDLAMGLTEVLSDPEVIVVLLDGDGVLDRLQEFPSLHQVVGANCLTYLTIGIAIGQALTLEVPT